MHHFKTLITVFLTTVLLCSCSGDMDSTEESDSYQTQSEKIGHEAAQMIKAPMDKAQDAVDQENERLQKFEKQLSE